ncbi:MAG: aldose epimerase family protein [Lachnospiraceae bacterium]|nr:aldose epimerase family protein [Lachnospiraceae bacterium]
MVKKWDFGKTSDGRDVAAYTIYGGPGASATILNIGCVVQSVVVPDKNGNPVEVTLGYDDAELYAKNPCCYGGLVGRNCNRIRGGKITIDGIEYSLALNDEGLNNLHSGPNGFQFRIWKEGKVTDNSVELLLESPEGDQGYPGKMDVAVTMTFTADNALIIDYRAEADKDTIANFTNHSYWNLNGAGEGLVDGHIACIHADRFVPKAADSVPDGTFCDVTGTSMDFRQPKKLGQDILAGDELLIKDGGYDHHFDINGEGFREACYVLGDKTGIKMTLSTDADGVQMYTGNKLNDPNGSKGKFFADRGGVAIEAQFVPNSINDPAYKTSLLKKGDVFTQKTVYAFSTV